METKKLILTTVVVALLGWSGFETYRYWAATQQLSASLELQRSVQIKLAHLKNVQVASKTAAATVKP